VAWSRETQTVGQMDDGSYAMTRRTSFSQRMKISKLSLNPLSLTHVKSHHAAVFGTFWSLY